MATAIFFVLPKRTSGKSKKAIDVLHKFNPWTPDTIPFMPNEREATVIHRKVTQSNVREIRRLRKRDKKLWAPLLIKAGIKINKESAQIDPKSKFLSDSVLIGLTLELGLGTSAAKPHWRPSIRELISTGIRKLAREPDIKKSFYDVNYGGWRQWKQHGLPILSKENVLKFKDFQRRVMAANR